MLLVNTSYSFEISFGSKPKEMPRWVSNPEEDDADYIYGVGGGDALATAVQSALNNINGKLATVVSSNISAETSVSQGKVSSNFSEDVRSKTLDTKLTNYEVLKSFSDDNHYFAMVRMSRQAFVKDTMARLKLVDDRLNNRVTIASKVSKLQQYLALNEIKPDITDATALVFLLQAASPSFASDKYLSVYQKYQAMLNEILFQMNFKVVANPALAPIADIVINILGSEKLSASTEVSGAPDAIITISGSAQKSIVFNEYSTQLRIKIRVTDISGRNINTEDHVVGGSSLTSYDASMITATNMLEKKLSEEGALAILGFQKPM
jgi:hypothetical protein